MLRRQDNDALDRWYEAVGRAFFVDGRHTYDPDVHRDLLEEIGFDRSLVDEALDDPTTADEVRADHDRVVSTVGAFGVPTLVFPDGNGIFGPVMLPAPTGERAVKLWDFLLLYNEFPTVWELRHPKTREHLTDIAETFSTYLEARAWKTIENPAP